MSAKKAVLFDISFDLLQAGQVHDWLAARHAGSDFGYVVTPNVDHVVRLETAGPDLHRSYSQADLCLCDSRVLLRIAKLLGVDMTLVSGSDLVAALFAHILRTRDRVCLIGGRETHIGALARLYPGIEVVQHIPPMGLADNPAARAAASQFAAQSGARVILLAVGSPQQELLAAEMARTPGITGTALCIGASVDFIVGERRRAPVPLRRAGLEWAWRLSTEPRRLARRYLVDGPRIFPMAWRWWRAEHKRAEVTRAR
jgi:N-acetylglucosaminyldiphosphoundecaprenol N-acetyl-beta-D-mannosaminyltransferase